MFAEAANVFTAFRLYPCPIIEAVSYQLFCGSIFNAVLQQLILPTQSILVQIDLQASYMKHSHF